MGRTWGITRNPLTFSPTVKDSRDLHMTQQAAPDGPDLVRCWLPAMPAPKMAALQNTPVLIVTGEASYHAPYDHCTSQFLTQAGIQHDFVRLADAGIRGNGHMMMLEKNNLEIAGFLERWVRENVR
jgi:pimeloyl-ACP methyl ester carboxylesterase